MTSEIWRTIEGFPDYEVSNLGRVRSNKYQKALIRKPRLGTNGYYQVGLYVNGKRIRKSIHRLVAQAFIPGACNSLEVNHINGIKTDNTAENLEWVTSSENKMHAVRTGLKSGQKSKIKISLKEKKAPDWKLTERQVREIKASNLPGGDLAQKYKVSHSRISKIRNNKSWTWV